MTSGPLKAAVIEGLASTGLPVTDIGEVLTPTVYFASASYDGIGAGVMITGSHLDTRYNGIKMAYGKLALAGEQIQDLLGIIDDEAFAVGSQPDIAEDFDMIQRHMAAIQSKVTMAKRMKVVLDAGNGLSGAYLPPVLDGAGAGCGMPLLRAGRQLSQPSAQPGRPGDDARPGSQSCRTGR